MVLEQTALLQSTPTMRILSENWPRIFLHTTSQQSKQKTQSTTFAKANPSRRNSAASSTISCEKTWETPGSLTTYSRTASPQCWIHLCWDGRSKDHVYPYKYPYRIYWKSLWDGTPPCWNGLPNTERIQKQSWHKSFQILTRSHGKLNDEAKKLKRRNSCAMANTWSSWETTTENVFMKCLLQSNVTSKILSAEDQRSATTRYEFEDRGYE